jgi:hypothetical protein
MIVLLDFHFHIETCKLGHVPRGIRVLGAEDRATAENTLPTAGDLNLLVKLRRLGCQDVLI